MWWIGQPGSRSLLWLQQLPIILYLQRNQAATLMIDPEEIADEVASVWLQAQVMLRQCSRVGIVDLQKLESVLILVGKRKEQPRNTTSAPLQARHLYLIFLMPEVDVGR